MAVLESSRGTCMSDSTTSVFIVTSFPAILSGKLYSQFDFNRRRDRCVFDDN